MTANSKARFSVYAGRILMTLSLLALVSAWVSQLTNHSVLGMSQQHLFNDSMALALLGIGSFLDSLYHAKGL